MTKVAVAFVLAVMVCYIEGAATGYPDNDPIAMLARGDLKTFFEKFGDSSATGRGNGQSVIMTSQSRTIKDANGNVVPATVVNYMTDTNGVMRREQYVYPAST